MAPGELRSTRRRNGDFFRGRGPETPSAQNRADHLKLVSPEVQEREARHVARQPAEVVERTWLDSCVFAQDLADYARTLEGFVDAAQRAGCTPVLCLEPLAVAPGDGEDAWLAPCQFQICAARALAEEVLEPLRARGLRPAPPEEAILSPAR